MRHRRRCSLVFGLAVALATGAAGLAVTGCRPNQSGVSSPGLANGGPTAAPGPAPRFDRLTRPDFNSRVVVLNQPLFWRSDANRDGVLDPDELVVTWNHAQRRRSDFVGADNAFTPAFVALYQALQAPALPDRDAPAAMSLSPAEKARRQAVRLELAQGRPTLVESDFSRSAAWENNLVAHLVRAAESIERIYARQRGTLGMEAQIPAGDTASAALFFRNQGPFCVAPKTENDPGCSALPTKPAAIYGLYPAEVQKDPAFCEALQRQPNADALLDHFSVAVAGNQPHTLRAVKYSVAFDQDMARVASELEAAAAGVPDDESALVRYLRAAAQAFRDNEWEPANQAWLAMGGGNSRYYLRVAPDEVYYEPCAHKAGFALTFGRINKESLDWQRRLEPLKQDMEDDLARMAGEPYQPRQVKFRLPDFLDIVLNAGNERSPLGATAGQSLPNWGPVADNGGRTMTMANLYSDVDSQQSLLDGMSSLYCRATMAKASADSKLFTLGIVLHEAAHNLGPAHGYRVNGKADDVVFGGPLAATLEELKAQTSALYLPARLLAKGLVSAQDVERTEVREIAWAFSNVAQGMYDAHGRAKNYSQLASIQLGTFERAGALEWKPAAPAANGSDQGCFEINFDKWNAAATELLAKVLSFKSRGDRVAAEGLKAEFVDADGDWKRQRALIADRWLRTPKATFVYSIGER